MFGLCSVNTHHHRVCFNDSTIPLPSSGKNKFTVIVEGNIGSGKSTFLKYFENNENVEVHAEPVEMWKNVRGHNTLDLMYKDPRRWALVFQSYVQLTMLQIHTKKQIKPVKMIERSIYSAKTCFVENLYDAGRMPAVDHDILLEWYDWILKNERVDADLIVYLRASPATCLERIKERNRQEECSMPLKYLEDLHQLHEDWLIHKIRDPLPAPVLVIDADKCKQELTIDLENKRTEILCGCE